MAVKGTGVFVSAEVQEAMRQQEEKVTKQGLLCTSERGVWREQRCGEEEGLKARRNGLKQPERA